MGFGHMDEIQFAPKSWNDDSVNTIHSEVIYVEACIQNPNLGCQLDIEGTLFWGCFSKGRQTENHMGLLEKDTPMCWAYGWAVLSPCTQTLKARKTLTETSIEPAKKLLNPVNPAKPLQTL